MRVTVYTVHGDKIVGETTGRLRDGWGGGWWVDLETAPGQFVALAMDAIYACEYEAIETGDARGAEGHPLFSRARSAEAPPESPAPGSDSKAP